MAQTETEAFRKCLKANLADDATLQSLCPGGIHFGYAPQKVAGKAPQTPYGIIRILSAPSQIGNDTHRVFTLPLIRVLFYGDNRRDADNTKIDQAARRADILLEELRYTVTDTVTEAGDAEPFEVRGFYRENATDEVLRDGNDLFGVKGGDYRGTGWYAPV